MIWTKRLATKRLVEFIEKQSLKRTFVSISEDIGLDEKTIRNVFRDYVNRLEKTVRFETPKLLGIDEIHIIRPRCVICNVYQRTIVDMLPNRNKDTVIRYLYQLPNREIVRYVCMDMWEPYRDAVAIALPFLQKSLKKKADEVIESIEGYQMAPEQKSRARLISSHLEFVEHTIGKLDSMLNVLAAPYKSAIQLLCAIPGVERASAITIISEIGTDMTHFSSSKRLCCWAGLTPGNNESAGKKKSVRITRAGVYLKPALVQVAHAAVKSKDDPYYRIKYERIAKRRGKKRAIIAIARMILTAIYQMLSTGEVFNPCDLYKIDMPLELRDKQKEKALKRAVKLLISQGIVQASDILDTTLLKPA